MKKIIPHIAPSQAGLSLLEVSISMMILGVIAAGSIPLYLHQRAHQAHMQSQTRQDFIKMAVAQYALQNQCLPCPAEDLQGQSRLSCTSAISCRGFVPYRTLGIPQEYAKDGHHRPWTYVIWHALGATDHPHDAKTGPERMARFFQAKDQPLHIYDRTKKLLTAYDQDPLALVLISHPSLEEIQGNTSQWIQHPYTVEQAGHPPVQVYWITRGHLMAHYAHYIWHPKEINLQNPQAEKIEERQEEEAQEYPLPYYEGESEELIHASP